MIQFCLKLGNGSFHRIALLLLVMGLIPMSERLFGQTNPLAPAYGFNIFVQNNVSIGPADVEGGFAAGGNFTFSPNGLSNYAGNANAGGVGNAYGTVSGTKYATVIGGNINWTGSVDHFDFNLNTTGALMKFGSVNGGTYASNRITNGSKFLNINGTHAAQNTTASFVQTGIINFSSEFATLTATSSCLSGLAQTIADPTSSSYSVTLATGLNVINITGAQLTSLSDFNVTNASSSRYLVINVNAAGSYTLSSLNQNFVSSAPYVLWNFYNATTLSVERLVGSLLAPLADVTKPVGANNIDGQVVAKSYTQLAGETHIASLNFNVTCGSSPTCTISTGGTIAADQTICSGGDPVAFTSSAAASGNGTITYQWQSSTSSTSTGFSNISGATSITYDIPSGLTQTTYYRRVATNTITGGATCTANSNALTVTVNTPPAIAECEARINGTWTVLANCVASVCPGNSLSLSVNPGTYPAGYTQSWSGPNGFTATGNDALVANSVTAANAGTYTFTVSNGVCSVSKTITVEVCCDAKITSLFFYHTNNDGNDIEISEGGILDINDLLSSYNLRATASGSNLSSVKFTVTGTSGGSSGTRTDGSSPYSYPTGSTTAFTASNLTVGSYSVKVEALNSGGTVCHDTTITFSVADIVPLTCNCPNNLVLNPSFEGTGAGITTNWTTSSGSTLIAATGTAGVTPPCGNDYAIFSYDGSSGSTPGSTRRFWQVINVGASMPAGSTITFAAFAGIGTPSGNHAASTSCGQNLMIEYYNGASLIRRDVSSNITNNIYSGAGPGFLPYSVTGIIPSNATSIRIGGEADCQFLKFDGACLQVECTNVAAGTDGSTSVCENSTTSINLFSLITGEDTGGTWSRLTGSGGTFTAGAGTYTPAAGATTSTFKYVLLGSCSNDTSVATVTIKPAPLPVIITGSNTACAGQPVQFCAEIVSGIQYYEWDFGTGATPSTSKNRCENVVWSTTGAKTISLYYIMLNGCTTNTITYNLTVNNTPNAGTDGSTTVCANSTTSINLFSLITGEQTGGTWSKVSGTGGTFSAGAGTFMPTSATTSVFRYVVNGTSPCPNDTSLATVNITPTFTLGDFVWYDQNNNGIQDGGEPGLGSVTVRLYDDQDNNNIPDGLAIQTTSTSPSGAYSFTGICQGRYIVSIVTPSGYIQSITTATSADPNNATANDNNGIAIYNTTELRSNDINLTADNPRVDFGLIGTGSIGDLVFKDNDGNGLQGGVGETGISGVIVTLTYTINGSNFTVKDTTDANGIYTFNNLPPGTYNVNFGTPSGYSATTANAGGNSSNSNTTDTNDSDPTGGNVTGIVLAAGENNLGIDAGFNQT
ncbi:MAG: SdrD B-like domain-containing protein, partial [Saprospiraceae bacterium]